MTSFSGDFEGLLNILVTGGAGFIGSALVQRLCDSESVTVIDSLDPQVHPSREFPASLASRARCIRADLRDPASYAADLGNIDTVVHLAAQTGCAQSMYELTRYASHNLQGTAALLEILSESQRKPRRFVLASSRAVYGDGVYQAAGGLRSAKRKMDNLRQGIWNPVDDDGAEVLTLAMRHGHPEEPTSIYGMTKLWQEQLVRSVCSIRNIDFAILRFQNVYGPGQAIGNPYTGIIGHFTKRILDGDEIELFEDGLMKRDFLFVHDAVKAVEVVIRHPERLDQTFDVGSGKETRLDAVAELLAEVTGRPAETRVSGRFRVGDVRHAVADTSRFCATFGDQSTTSLDVGLAKYYEWFRTQARSTDRHRAALDELENRGLFQQSAPGIAAQQSA